MKIKEYMNFKDQKSTIFLVKYIFKFDCHIEIESKLDIIWIIIWKKDSKYP